MSPPLSIAQINFSHLAAIDWSTSPMSRATTETEPCPGYMAAPLLILLKMIKKKPKKKKKKKKKIKH